MTADEGGRAFRCLGRRVGWHAGRSTFEQYASELQQVAKRDERRTRLHELELKELIKEERWGMTAYWRRARKRRA